MKVVVLGAGVVGVCSAWYLAEAGHEVVVIDRQPAAALETSFANGGQISVCHAEPWANPATPLKMLRWLGHESSPLLWRLRADPDQWAWGLRFLRECSQSRSEANIAALIALGLYSRAALLALRDTLGLDYDQQRRGILHVYTDRNEFDHAVPRAALMTRLGCTRIVQSADDCAAIEPALAPVVSRLVGGTYTPDDESGDAHKFTQALVARCAARGVEFRFDREITGFARDDTRAHRVAAVCVSEGPPIAADAFVVALGSYSTPLLRPLGVRLAMYPAKGYSITIPLAAEAMAPSVSITDDGHKLVFSRLGNRLRVAGTAEFCGYDLTLNGPRLAALQQRTEALFPGVRAAGAIEPWCGLRPATPGNLPLIGAVRAGSGEPFDNLYLNTGHGTLGWTLACGSARVLTDLMAGRRPALDARPYLPA